MEYKRILASQISQYIFKNSHKRPNKKFMLKYRDNEYLILSHEHGEDNWVENGVNVSYSLHKYPEQTELFRFGYNRVLDFLIIKIKDKGVWYFPDHGFDRDNEVIKMFLDGEEDKLSEYLLLI